MKFESFAKINIHKQWFFLSQAWVVDEQLDSFTALPNTCHYKWALNFILKDIGDENWLNLIIFVGV